MAVTFLEFVHVTICQLAHVIRQELQYEQNFPYDHIEYHVKFTEKGV